MKQETTKSVKGERAASGLSDTRHEPRLRKSFRAKPALYGLPCSDCKTYYEGDFDACPLCGCTDRVSPTETNTGGHRAVCVAV